MPRGALPMDPAERFNRHVKRTEACWLWTGAIYSNGYGRHYITQSRPHKYIMAHRQSYLLFVGPIPEGLMILHQCDNRRCVRPDHLRIGTARENTADMIERGRSKIGTHNKSKTQCRHGHEFTPDNTRIDFYGRRECRKCFAARSSAARERRRSAAGLPVLLGTPEA